MQPTYQEKRKRDMPDDNDQYAYQKFYGNLFIILMIPACSLASILYIPVLLINAFAQ